MASLNFNAEGIDTTSAFDPIPAGDYEAMATGSRMMRTKDNSGEYLELTFEVQSGQFRGRKLWDRLNLNNHNTTAAEIAQRKLAQLCHATGVMQVSDSEQLHNRPVIMKVAVKNDPNRGPSNEIKGYKARAAAGQQAPAFIAPRVNAQAPAFSAPAPAPQAAAAPAPLPWMTARAAA